MEGSTPESEDIPWWCYHGMRSSQLLSVSGSYGSRLQWMIRKWQVNCCDPDQLQALLRARLGAVWNPVNVGVQTWRGHTMIVCICQKHLIWFTCVNPKVSPPSPSFLSAKGGIWKGHTVAAQGKCVVVQLLKVFPGVPRNMACRQKFRMLCEKRINQNIQTPLKSQKIVSKHMCMFLLNSSSSCGDCHLTRQLCSLSIKVTWCLELGYHQLPWFASLLAGCSDRNSADRRRLLFLKHWKSYWVVRFEPSRSTFCHSWVASII